MKRRDEIRERAKHKFLEAWVQLESRKAGHTLSHVELNRLLDYSSAASLNQQVNRERKVADILLWRISRANPEYTNLINSLMFDEPVVDFEKGWMDQIESIYTLIKEVA